MNKQEAVSKSTLIEQTITLVGNYLLREAQFLSHPESGNGTLSIIFNFKHEPKLEHTFETRIVKKDGREYITFPKNEHDDKLFKRNYESLYMIINNYITSRSVASGVVTAIFENGKIVNFKFMNTFLYRDVARYGKGAYNLEIDLYDDEDEE
jgi:hypothetical protein